MRRQADFDGLDLASSPIQPHLPVNEPNKMLHPIQNGLNLELNSWSPRSILCFLVNYRVIEPLEISYFFGLPVLTDIRNVPFLVVQKTINLCRCSKIMSPDSVTPSVPMPSLLPPCPPNLAMPGTPSNSPITSMPSYLSHIGRFCFCLCLFVFVFYMLDLPTDCAIEPQKLK